MLTNTHCSPMGTADIFIPASPPLHPKTSIHFRSSVRLRKPSILHLNFTQSTGIRSRFLYRPFAILRKSDSSASASSNNGTNSTEEDFVTRVLKENPSQLEPKYLIGDKLYTSKEKEDLKTSSDFGLFEFLKRLNLKKKKKQKSDEEVRDENEVKSDAVYLKDILREYRGKLYVPEQIFGANLSQEEEFDMDLEALPKMSLEDFRKAMRNDKIKLITFKEERSVPYGFKDYIVELKEIPGAKNLHRTKW